MDISANDEVMHGGEISSIAAQLYEGRSEGRRVSAILEAWREVRPEARPGRNETSITFYLKKLDLPVVHRLYVAGASLEEENGMGQNAFKVAELMECGGLFQLFDGQLDGSGIERDGAYAIGWFADRFREAEESEEEEIYLPPQDNWYQRQQARQRRLLQPANQNPVARALGGPQIGMPQPVPMHHRSALDQQRVHQPVHRGYAAAQQRFHQQVHHGPMMGQHRAW